MLLSCKKWVTFSCKSVLSIIITALLLSALATVIFLLDKSSLCFLIMFRCHLCSGICSLFSFICFIRAVACSLYMFCHLGSKRLMAFSVSIISSFIYLLGFCSIAFWGPSLETLVCSCVSFIFVTFMILGCVRGCVCGCLAGAREILGLFVSALNFLLRVWYLPFMFLFSNSSICTIAYLTLTMQALETF